MIKNLLYTCLFALGFISIQAQDGPPANWFNLDKEKDGVYGVSTERAYEEELKGKSSVTVVVAVIDSGVDAEHEDLDDVMWVNKDEIPGNGIDDDKNGYIDDIHGWNFIGGKDGKNVNDDTLEATRLYKKYKYKYEKANPSQLTKKQKAEYAIYLKVKEEVESKLESAEKNIKRFQERESSLMASLDAVDKAIGKNPILETVLDSLAGLEDKDLAMGANIAKNLLGDFDNVADMKEEVKGQLTGAFEYYGNQIKYMYNIDFDPRNIVGDDYSNSYEKGYGNNDVEGPDALHGTHVAGIIAAERDNGVGMNGVANNVQIMSVRTVPNGDERDKDVANAIIYAVDNGATVVNMSFGKGYSWDEEAVEKAIKYAEKKDVLLVHAAGNSSQDNDDVEANANFPNDNYKKKFLFWKRDKVFKNWIEVGALNYKEGEDSVAPFSNYGQKNVDIFAPGMKIYATVPDNEYMNLQGTSMASPVVAGVAAMIRSYYPSLTAEQVKDIIMETSEKRQIKVKKPGTDEIVDFSTLSVTGGEINALKAIQLAAKTKGKKKIKTTKA